MEIRPIHTESDYKEALRTVSALVDLDPEIGTDDGDKLEILATLIERYEAEEFPMGLPDPIETRIVCSVSGRLYPRLNHVDHQICTQHCCWVLEESRIEEERSPSLLVQFVCRKQHLRAWVARILFSPLRIELRIEVLCLVVFFAVSLPDKWQSFLVKVPKLDTEEP